MYSDTGHSTGREKQYPNQFVSRPVESCAATPSALQRKHWVFGTGLKCLDAGQQHLLFSAACGCLYMPVHHQPAEEPCLKLSYQLHFPHQLLSAFKTVRYISMELEAVHGDVSFAGL